MNIYVGNLSFDSTEQSLHTAFAAYGAVGEARLITDRETGRSRGFAFVEMPNKDEAEQAIKGMNGKELDGRELTVNEARPKGSGGGGGGGGGGYGGGGGGYGGGGGGNRW